MRIGPASLSHNIGFVSFCSSVISSSFGFLYCGRSLAMVDLDLQYPCTLQLKVSCGLFHDLIATLESSDVLFVVVESVHAAADYIRLNLSLL